MNRQKDLDQRNSMASSAITVKLIGIGIFFVGSFAIGGDAIMQAVNFIAG